jgi:hypothetical protein
MMFTQGDALGWYITPFRAKQIASQKSDIIRIFLIV